MRKLVAFLGVVAIVCGLAAGDAVAQTNSYANMLNTIQNQNQSWYNQLNAYNRQSINGVAYSYDYANRQYVTGLPIFPSIGVKGEF